MLSDRVRRVDHGRHAALGCQKYHFFRNASARAGLVVEFLEVELDLNGPGGLEMLTVHLQAFKALLLLDRKTL